MSRLPKKSPRRPPLPYWDAGKGFCRFCGQVVHDVKGNILKRALWHPVCAKTYLLMTRSTVMRRFIWKRDRGRCAQCGTQHIYSGDWEADHKHPLGLVDRTLPWREVIKYWLPWNVQTLCRKSCHEEKTRRDIKACHHART